MASRGKQFDPAFSSTKFPTLAAKRGFLSLLATFVDAVYIRISAASLVKASLDEVGNTR
ncbi:hypothetical protein ACLB1Q_31870 [Escherichia coli]